MREWGQLRAHTDADCGRKDRLGDHLAKVADRTGQFAAVFGSQSQGEALGRLHDVGKATEGFQKYLDRIEAGQNDSAGPPHAIWGAALAYWMVYKRLGDEEAWKEISLPVAGHHSGLAAAGELALRIDRFLAVSSDELAELAKVLADAGILRYMRAAPVDRNGTAREFFIRFLLSSLADADYLATEEHFKPRAAIRRRGWPALDELWKRFLPKQQELIAEASKEPTPVNRVRAEVYRDCLASASSPRGFFRLTVPTGGGKTRSGLAFALQHALQRGLRRVVVAVPYTSITDQTAREYRSMLGGESVLEHHSQVAVEKDDESQSVHRARARAAAENWDAPLIVTTTVQLFESLFANHPGKVRKLHNLAGAVIVLDEAQTLPVELLEPILDALKLLVCEYGCSVVFCTATQPAYEGVPKLRSLGELGFREIVPEYPRHFEALQSRLEYIWRDEPIEWDALAKEIRDLPQVLVVLNSRANAMALLDALGETANVVHLSTLLCGAHRRKVLSDINSALESGHDVRAICIQVIEAGVDIDFPVAYRAVGPLDRLIQVGGRCNRSGTRPQPGQVIIFEPRSGTMPRGPYSAGTITTRSLLGRHGVSALRSPEVCAEYFARLFSDADLDAKGVRQFRVALDYPEVAKRFRFIEPTVPALVSYGDAEARVRDYQRWPSRDTWRALQPYVVSIFCWQVMDFEQDGYLRAVEPGLYRWLGAYDEIRGIVPNAIDPTDLII